MEFIFAGAGPELALTMNTAAIAFIFVCALVVSRLLGVIFTKPIGRAITGAVLIFLFLCMALDATFGNWSRTGWATAAALAGFYGRMFWDWWGPAHATHVSTYRVAKAAVERPHLALPPTIDGQPTTRQADYYRRPTDDVQPPGSEVDIKV
jgi:hypothetical protein